MGGSFKIGRFSGIDVRVHWTFLLLLAFFAFIGYQTSGSLAGALTPTAVIVALFICVVLHEFGHSLVAQRLGIVVRSITLLPIGSCSTRSCMSLVMQPGVGEASRTRSPSCPEGADPTYPPRS